jgi:hypothetical protein
MSRHETLGILDQPQYHFQQPESSCSET